MSEIVAKEVFSTIYSKVLSCLPYGEILNEFITLKGRIQQERLNKFSEYLRDGFESITGKEFNPENVLNEDFIDTVDFVLRKVIATKSEEKLKRYSNVLLRQVFDNDPINETFLKYVSLIDDVSDTQIMILDYLAKKHYKHSIQIIQEMAEGERNINGTDFFTPDDSIRLNNGQVVRVKEMDFLITDLKSRGFLNIKTMVTIDNTAELLSLSTIGEGFLAFIKEYSN